MQNNFDFNRKSVLMKRENSLENKASFSVILFAMYLTDDRIDVVAN